MVAESPPVVDAWSIFEHTRSAVTSVRYPWRVDYTIVVSGFDGQTPVKDHYRASFDPLDGSIKVFPISDEQLKAPAPVPHGVNASFVISISGGRGSGTDTYSIPMGHPAAASDLLGEPLIAPTYMFGLRYPGIPYNVKPVGTESALSVIATVSTKNRDYDVAWIGDEDIAGVDTYHLQLTPLRKPKSNRLRDLWVGTSDYLPRKAVIAGNFTTAPLVDIPWTVDFSVIGGEPFVVREAAGTVLYLSHHRVVRDALIGFEDIGEPNGSIYDRPLVAPSPSDSSLSEPSNK